MRKTVTWGLVLLLLVAGYSAWPFLALFRLLDAVERRDAAQVSEMLDLPRLRRDLVSQVVATYARVAGTRPSPGMQQVAAALAGSVADPLVAKLITTEAVAELVRTGWSAAAFGPEPAQFDRLRIDDRPWRLYLNSEYGFDEFRLWVPVDKPKTQQYRLLLQRHGFDWKLAGVRLPQPIQEHLVRELMQSRREK